MQLTYLKSRFLRTYIWAALLCLIAALGWFQCFFAGVAAQKELEREKAYDIPVELVITDLGGTSSDRLGISGVELWAFIKDKENVTDLWIIPRDLRPYFGELRVKTSLYYKSGELSGRLIGLTDLNAEEALRGAEIVFSDGEDADFESSKSPQIIVSERFFEKLRDESGGISEVSVAVGTDSGLQNAFELAVKPTGYYTGLSTDDIYCSWNLAADIIRSLGEEPYADSISATVKDNGELDALKEDLSYYFTEADPTETPKRNPNAVALYYYKNAAVIHDELMRNTLTTLDRNIAVLNGLFPITAALECLVSAAAAYFYIALRRRDVAIMRSLGTKSAFVIVITAAEMFVICAAAFALSLAAAAAIPICEIKISSILLVELSALLGGVVSAGVLTRRGGIEILKEND